MAANNDEDGGESAVRYHSTSCSVIMVELLGMMMLLEEDRIK